MNTSNTTVNSEVNDIQDLSAYEIEEVSGGAVYGGVYD